ncbi:protein FAM83D [Microcaecilia unicolor]|uniref:Protein FAM83D n=1 Tax=Microcaecilia unicolor TaxID=1415580 RepID=A0A6P7YIC8_9AMPH|nr:protein FAM83D [Microcaecilia unicolor]
MANQSQCLEDLAPGSHLWPPRPGEAAALHDLYSEEHRLALEELIAGGREAFWAFLRKERVSGFLSEEEIEEILGSVAAPPAAGDDSADQSLSASMDCSSVTYFPEQSDVEPPLLELGWPAFCTGSYRGVTRVDVHFQPSFGDTIYSCKDAARKLIRAAREVIAVVMDSFTDIDIFRDLQEACRKRNVPVYILLDQSLLPQFLKMCQNLGVFPEQEKLMRVRTITGNTYYTRSGAKITGKVHEKFMLVDGLKVATGNYSFTWTDGKLNSSNMLVLTGQVVEHFDLQYRILYAQSKPINPKLLSSFRTSGRFDYTVDKRLPLGKFLRSDLAKRSSTPKKSEDGKEVNAERKGAELERKDPISDSSTIGEDNCLQHCDAVFGPKVMTSTSTQTELWKEKPTATVSDAVTQTTAVTKTAGTQTCIEVKITSTQTMVSSKTTMTQTDRDENLKFSDQPSGQLKERPPAWGRSATYSSVPSSSSSSSTSTISSNDSIPSIRSDYLRSGYSKYYTLNQSEYTLRDCFKKLNKDRQYHYTAIRAKLDHMVAILSKRNRFESYTRSHVTKHNLKRRNEIHSSLLSLRDVVYFTPSK